MTKRVDPEVATKMATDIVVAFLGGRSVEAAELPGLVRQVRAALLEDLASDEKVSHASAPFTLTSAREALAPPVPVSESITPDWLICLEDGQRYKSLKRHLKARYGMSPEDYRRKWGLPDSYPMVAPNYSSKRSTLARSTGFAQHNVERRPA